MNNDSISSYLVSSVSSVFLFLVHTFTIAYSSPRSSAKPLIFQWQNSPIGRFLQVVEHLVTAIGPCMGKEILRRFCNAGNFFTTSYILYRRPNAPFIKIAFCITLGLRKCKSEYGRQNVSAWRNIIIGLCTKTAGKTQTIDWDWEWQLINLPHPVRCSLFWQSQYRIWRIIWWMATLPSRLLQKPGLPPLQEIKRVFF